MRNFNAFQAYPNTVGKRLVDKSRGDIASRMVAAYRGREFYDGDRSCGYGGMRYDGRWGLVALDCFRHYRLDECSRVLQIGCDKGFLLQEFRQFGIRTAGTEVSQYAIGSAAESVRPGIQFVPPWALPFDDATFDLVICAGPVYTLTLEHAMQCLREIGRVGRGQSFITLGAYETEKDFWLFRAWTLLGTTILKPSEWLEVLEHVGYSGDYTFVTAKTLGLEWA